ncbi:nucleotide-diphospho-sugar transferase [Mycotypha africana]|uniref:nucleotide-diphospho-sugar transferase n=1 Tax=Mycotypha africana TaxID=64632 RepID=UPI002300F4EF|nr:nucleotide-diphospho-sugar transferase [Mycotypha africana]KAI8991826.1 nucleotide-diphospho-sugar transferase [Mycotypha africana]
MPYHLKKFLIRISLLLTVIVTIAFLTLSFLTSLYKTIPANIPFFSNVPMYKNKWQYIPPLEITHPNPAFTAAYITFVNGDKESLSSLRSTMRNIEDQFNRHYHYPFIIFTVDEPSVEFKELVSSTATGDVVFERVTISQYGYGNRTDQFRASLSRKYLKDTPGNTEASRFKSRLMAGTIFKHESLFNLDYFWRFEPGTEYLCPISFDPFQYMYDNGKQLSFSLSSYELHETLPSIFDTVAEFKKENPQLFDENHDNKLWKAMTNKDGSYNRCSFWNSFQIVKTSFFTSKRYQSYFDFMDHKEGIFYERWSDSVIQSLGAALFLNKTEVHFWESIGYRHQYQYQHCPNDKAIWEKCSCRPMHNFDNDGLSCLSKFV